MKLTHLSLLIGLSASLAFTGCKKDEDDPCDNVVCQNGGTCNSGSCSCASGYEGSTCGTEVRAKFIGQYNGTLSCPGVNGTVNMTITNSAAGITTIVFNDGADTWTGTVSGSSVNIPTQTLSGGATISGSGQLAGLILTLNFNLAGNTCTYSGTKQ
ncbi:MAG TPA: calcium-binding EGF-like domain-containing protein [Flavobacteriales bacterium]|nr:calcium-binding EGF-like domain-containing protein [Flavobacteriales bacterium]HNU58299.1 calcium-binding EGF-like domain-containing protein [Flavobacteriales bacterium]